MEPTEGTTYPSGGGDTITARDLLHVLQEKDRLLSTLLERQAVVGAAQPQPAPTFQVIARLKPQHQSLRRLRGRSFSARVD
ncbi:hypothetical protein MTO96_047277 [Rhipicephalus appendiculatus]